MENGQISIWRTLGMELPTVQQRKRLRVSEVNPHLICVLCGGYYIDATTITECLHTFCKTCIVGYLEASKHCPVCDNLVHKTKPHLRLRPDHTLQDLVYKLVPGLFKDEMNKRREFYKDEIQTGKLGENGIPEERERIIYSQDEQISLVLEMSSNGRPPLNPSAKSNKHNRLEAADRRFLQCPANITVGHLKKFLKMKFNLCDRFQIDFFHTDEILHDHYTLVDIAYIYSWRRKGPLGLYYTVFTNPAKRFKVDHEQDIVIEETEIPTKEADISKESERTETSGYLTDDDKEMDDRSMESNILPESGSNDSFELDSSDIDSSVRLETIEKVFGKAEDVKVVVTSKETEQNGVEDDTKDISASDIPKSESFVVNDGVKKDKAVGISEITKDVGECKNGKEEQEIKGEKNGSVPKGEIKVSKDMSQIQEKDNNSVTNEYVNKKQDQIDEIDKNVNHLNDTTSEVTKESEALNKDIGKSNDLEKSNSDISKNKIKTEKPQTSEASTSTFTNNDMDIQRVAIRTDTISKIKDDDVSEPVVSSTQNTQACQTEPPEAHLEKFILPQSSDLEKSDCEITKNREKVDVSCETDNFVTARQISRESVSVSTETEIDTSSSNERKKSVDCATDVLDFPKSPNSSKQTVDCSTDSQDFPDLVIDSKRNVLTVDCSTEIDESSISNKRKALTIDCSTEIDNRSTIQIKRKSIDSHDQKIISKKNESKVTKRSNSYSAHSPKTSYMAQPLSPTKITLKFSATKPSNESIKPEPAPKTQSQVTGFQSKYQSFVLELPEKTFNFNNEPDKRVQPALPAKTTEGYKQTYMNTISTSAKRSPFKVGRPRGRPPKIKNPDQVDSHKEKKHKSRSHSPKHKKSSDKHKYSTSVTLPATVSSLSSTSSNAYSWMHKVDHGTKTHGSKKQQKSKTLESANERPPGELKIPKQFVYFSNGQYTLATESSLATLKASSPRSPTRTVWETQTSSYGDKHSKSEKSKEKEKKRESKIEKSAATDKQITKSESANDSNNHKKIDEVKILKSTKSDTDSKEIHVDVKDNLRNRAEVKTSQSVSNTISETLSSTVTSTSDSVKEAVSSSSEKFPEYRHQSPFFTSFSRLGAHRPSTHLNIPSFASHFNSAHPLYAHGRYTSERLGIPIYRSMSLNEPKNVNVPNPISKTPEKQRLDSMNSPCGFLPPYPSPYLGLSHLHSHLASSLPPPLSQKGYSPDSTKPHTPVFSVSSVNTSNSISQSKGGIKSVAIRKGKEKSIDNIISAITEMRTKKETAQEQLNGIDLSTKSSRQNAISMATNNNDKVDKYAFPDDDDDSKRSSAKKGSVS